MLTQSSRFAWPALWHFPALVQGRFLFPSLVFLPFLPVNQTGVKRRLISLLSGWQCLGDRALVANWMVLGPFSSCINPSDISFALNPLCPCPSFLLTPPFFYQSFFPRLSNSYPPLPSCQVWAPQTPAQLGFFPPWPVSSFPSLLALRFPPLHWTPRSHQRELISALLPG